MVLERIRQYVGDKISGRKKEEPIQDTEEILGRKYFADMDWSGRKKKLGAFLTELNSLDKNRFTAYSQQDVSAKMQQLLDLMNTTNKNLYEIAFPYFTAKNNSAAGVVIQKWNETRGWYWNLLRTQGGLIQTIDEHIEELNKNPSENIKGSKMRLEREKSRIYEGCEFAFFTSEGYISTALDIVGAAWDISDKPTSLVLSVTNAPKYPQRESMLDEKLD